MSNISEVNGVIFITADGKYVKVYSHLTHIGSVDDVEYVSDINEATVFTSAISPRLLDKMYVVAKLRASCVVNRTVKITGEVKSNVKES